MFAPGLAPGRTLSASDFLWTATPWQALRPPEIPPLGSNGEQADAVSQFQPALLRTRAVLPDIPLWDPSMLNGRPFLADPQSQVFSPFSVPAYVLPFWKSLGVIAALKVFVAALGGFVLGRTFGMRFAGALLTGLVFGFSLWSVTWVSWTVMSVWALLPWLCVVAERCVRRPGPLPAAALGAVVGLQFLGGHPSSSFQILAVVTAAWIVRALATRSLRRRLASRLLTLAAGLVLGTALAAVMLLPFAELLSRSSDIAIRTAGADFHQQPRRLLGIFLHDWWGRAGNALEFASAEEEHAYYGAVLPLMLAATALIVRPRRERVAVAAVGLGLLAVATGLPPLYDLVVRLPGFDAANNGRLAVVSVLCVAVLAGWGLDELIAGGPPAARTRAVLGVALALFALPVVLVAGRVEPGALGTAVRVAWTFASPTSELTASAPGGQAGVIRLAALLDWLALGVLALALVFLRVRGRLGANAFVALAIALVAADLFKAGMGYNPAIPLRHATQPTTPARSPRPGGRRDAWRPTSPCSRARVSWPPDSRRWACSRT